jgi:hypothetical protein
LHLTAAGYTLEALAITAVLPSSFVLQVSAVEKQITLQAT